MPFHHFLKAQDCQYQNALSEIKDGQKKTHWMWFIFPQVLGLGNSEVSKRYGISSLQEASLYLEHPELGTRLITITTAVFALENNSVNSFFGTLDAKKLQSSMTLFSETSPNNTIFTQVLNKHYGGQRCKRSLELLAWHLNKLKNTPKEV
ncbi:MAG: DUF1810 domain-containing protein [Flavobacteriaceae bacterium]|nr:DUF1810 domain-containing protein [Flavobacteriaceae bacterium]